MKKQVFKFILVGILLQISNYSNAQTNPDLGKMQGSANTSNGLLATNSIVIYKSSDNQICLK